MKDPRSGSGEFVRRIERRATILLLSFVVVGLILGGWRSAAGAALGGVLSLFGFRCLKGVVHQALTLPSPRARGKVVVHHYAWIVCVGCAVGVAFWLRLAEPLWVILGLSVLVINLLVSAVADAKKIEAEV